MKQDNTKRKRAVALKYNTDMKAPKVLAKGKGYIAKNILENAQDNNIHIYQDKALVEELDKIEIGLNIPKDLYEAVANVLLFVGELDKKQGYKKYEK